MEGGEAGRPSHGGRVLSTAAKSPNWSRRNTVRGTGRHGLIADIYGEEKALAVKSLSKWILRLCFSSPNNNIVKDILRIHNNYNIGVTGYSTYIKIFVLLAGKDVPCPVFPKHIFSFLFKLMSGL